MDRHTYSLETVNGISNEVAEIYSYLANATISIESMPYSWNTGIINTVVQWIEVKQVNQLKNSLLDFFANFEMDFDATKSDIVSLDQAAGCSIDNCSIKISEGISIIDTLSSFLDDAVPMPTTK